MPLLEHLHPDRMQQALLLLCAVDLGFFTYYMVSLNLQGRHTISDTLFSTPAYAVVLTCTLVGRQLGVVFYLIRYRHAARWHLLGGALGLALSLFGWVWLVLHQENRAHFAGVFVFCVGTFVYSLALLFLCEESHPHLAQLHFWLEILLFGATTMLVFAFGVVWFAEEQAQKHVKKLDSNGRAYENPDQTAYIVEHFAYIAFILFYACFFLFHTPDWEQKPFVDSEVEMSPLVTV